MNLIWGQMKYIASKADIFNHPLSRYQFGTQSQAPALHKGVNADLKIPHDFELQIRAL